MKIKLQFRRFRLAQKLFCYPSTAPDDFGECPPFVIRFTVPADDNVPDTLSFYRDIKVKILYNVKTAHRPLHPHRFHKSAIMGAPPTPAESQEHQQLLNRLDIAQVPRPFRNPNWRPSQRRNKNVKQLISENSRKEASVMATQANSGASTPLQPSTDGSQTPADSSARTNIAQAAQNLSTLVLEKNARAMLPSGPAVTYTNIESAPSLHPSQHTRYCDITGLPAPYTDPKTRLRYHDKEVFGVIRTLSQGVPESYLELRGAHVVLK
jgi:INO80 complex subunit C